MFEQSYHLRRMNVGAVTARGACHRPWYRTSTTTKSRGRSEASSTDPLRSRTREDSSMHKTTVHMSPAGNHRTDGAARPQQARLDFVRIAPEAVRAQLGLERYVHGSGLEPSLIELVKLRASMVNGCAYCVDMHTKDAR